MSSSEKEDSSPLHDSQNEPIAIVGMACRWPGGIESPSELWDFLKEGRDAYGKFPADRINVEAFYHPDAHRPGSFFTEGGCFLKEDPRNFDHTFFGIHPKEVASMDPAQRKFMEVVYEAFESASVPLCRIAGSNTGTFVGNFNYDHQLMQYRDAEYPQPYSVTGGGITILSNRVNYVFDFKGPSMTMDTACSSSLYALHMACEAIHSGDCTAAIAGDSNLILTPECQIFSSALGAVSPTSRCHTFDAAADGYARADGVGVLYVKKLSEAIKDKDPIRAVIRATAVNANGRTGGISHPSPDGQEAVIRRAYEKAGNLDLDMTAYFECHGTGTPVGDPIETDAIGRVFAGGRSPDKPLYIGSIKSNLGHSEPSSGIAGIMKVVLAMEKGSIPPTVGITKLNPNVNLWKGRLQIPVSNMRWPSRSGIERASVNSFGYGGANAHAIIESAASYLREYAQSMQCELHNGTRTPSLQLNGDPLDPQQHRYILPLSSHDQRTLMASTHSLMNPNLSDALGDVSYTLTRRSALSYRTFAIVSPSSVNAGLKSAAERQFNKIPAKVPRVGFVFTGQGAQWPRMGLALIEQFAEFAQCIDELDHAIDLIDSSRSWTIEAEIRRGPEESNVHKPECAQPLVTAIQIGICELLKVWNIDPVAVVGHSSGEIAASFAAGLSTKEEAIVAAYLRGKTVARNRAQGAMLAVGASADDCKKYLPQNDAEVSIACYNSPQSCTLSGPVNSLAKIKEALDSAGIFARELITGGNAYHSAHMVALGEQYQKSMQDALPGSDSNNRIRNGPAFFSTVYGERLGHKPCDSSYWRANLESPVLFSQAASEMLRTMDLDSVIEIGPHCALQGPFRQITQNLGTEGGHTEYVSSLVRGNNSEEDILELAGNLFMRGYPINIGKVNRLSARFPASTPKIVLGLPHYPWQYDERPIITENRWTREWRLREHPRHDILGSRVPGGIKSNPVWRNLCRIEDTPWLAQHCIGEDVVMPSAGYIAMALEAALQVVELADRKDSDIAYIEIQDMTLSRALLLDDDEAVEILFSMKPVILNNAELSEQRFEFQLTSVVKDNGKDSFVENCRGCLEVGFELIHEGPNQLSVEVDALQDFYKRLNVSSWYERFSQIGLRYGPAFQGLLELHAVSDSNMTSARIENEPPAKTMGRESRYIIHPATLDSALQLAMVSAHGNKVHTMKRAFMPTKIERLIVRPQEKLLEDKSANLIARGVRRGIRGLSANICLKGGRSTTPFLEAKNVFFILSDQPVSIPEVGYAPYTRVVWKPLFSSLDTDKVRSLFPPIALSKDAVIPSLNKLALAQLIDFRIRHSGHFEKGNVAPHLNRMLQWTDSKLFKAKAKSDSLAEHFSNLSLDERDAEIGFLAEKLNAESSESRLMCHMYNNLNTIFDGNKTGIQVALQDNLLIDNYEHGQVYKEGNSRLAKVVELLAHERPGLSILEVGAGTGSATREVVKALHGDTIWRRYSKYHFTDTTPSFLSDAENAFANYHGISYGTFDMEKPSQDQGYKPEWDLVIASNVIHATSDIQSTLENIRSVLKPGGRMILLELTESQLSAGLVLGTFSDFWKGDSDTKFPRHDGPFLNIDMWKRVLPLAGFSGLDFHLDDYSGENRSATVISATAIHGVEVEKEQASPVETGVSIVFKGELSPTVVSIKAKYVSNGTKVELLPITNCTAETRPKFHRVIFLLELERPFFTAPSETEWQAFQLAVTTAKSILWVSAGALMRGGEPAFAMIAGIIRGLKIEMSNIKFARIDLEDPMLSDQTPDLVRDFEQRVATSEPGNDVEFQQKNGIIHVSRLYQDKTLNKRMSAMREKESTSFSVLLKELKDVPIQLDIEKPGVLITLLFRDDHNFQKPIAHDQVEIGVIAAGINNKDVAVVTGRHHSDTFSDECVGHVTRKGKNVKDLQIGDLVQCLSFARFGNIVREKAIFCSKVDPLDTALDAATLPIAFSTAKYGLIDLGRLSAGESVLIQSATGAVGLAAIQIARLHGAEIFATVGSEKKKQALLELEPTIKEANIFWSRERQTVNKIMSATEGKGIDVVLCSSRGQLMHDYWRCIAPSGRFIEIGRTEILGGGQIALDVFNRNATFASFDLEVLSTTKPHIVQKLMSKIAELRANGLIRPLPYEVYHLSQIEQAMVSFAKARHIGKKILTYDYANEQPIKYRPGPFRADFDPDATYMLVGGLGGLGRCFARWAVDRGARSLLFLSRGGATSPEAAKFVQDLRAREIEVEIALGDVCKFEEVCDAVKKSTKPIKGVVQAALSLDDGSFESMTLDKFNAATRSRVQGTYNLHDALSEQPLDFFQMWSSWTLQFGTATQCNYLCSNAFMDAFARYRRSLGLPATSLSLSQILGVGIVSYMPEYQQAMIRNGFYGNNEEEFLAYCEAGIIKDQQLTDELDRSYDPDAAAHLLVGIEPAGLADVDKTHPLEDMAWASDPRFRLLLQSTRLHASTIEQMGESAEDHEADGVGLEDQIRVKISRLLYVSADDIALDKPINSYGIDSMVAAELRNWLFAKHNAEISLLNLLDNTMTVEKLAQLVGGS